MREDELRALIARGEDGELEFKSRDITPENLAKEIVAFANLRGGRILLGVDDNGEPAGWSHKESKSKTEEWLMNTVVAEYVKPRLDVDYRELTLDGNLIGIVSVPLGVQKPYVLRRGKGRGGEDMYTRMGSVSRVASREQMMLMMDAGVLGHTEKMALTDSDYRAELNLELVENYFGKVDKAGHGDTDDLERLMRNRDLLVKPQLHKEWFCSYAAYILFAHNPMHRLPQAGIRISVFSGTEKDTDAVMDKVLDAPFLGYSMSVPNLPDLVSNYLRPHISRENVHSDMRRRREWDYPEIAVREIVVNAFAHRDWTRLDQTRITVYSDRLEVQSPGALPNGMTVEKIMAGEKISRNPKIVRILHDYGFVEDHGLGICRRVIPLMREYNGCEPEFVATEDYFRVVLPKKAAPGE